MRWVLLEPTKLESSNGFILRPQPMREFVASIFNLTLKGTVPDSTVLDE